MDLRMQNNGNVLLKIVLQYNARKNARNANE